MPNLNTRLFEFVNNAAGYYHPLDLFFVVITSDVTIAIVAIAVALYVIFYRKAFREFGFITMSVLVTWIVVTITKAAVAFPRPFTTLPNLHTLISLPTDYSFPSGHAALTMAFATAVYFYRRRLGELLFLFAFTVGIARIYVGVHYPLDVAVGFLLGYFIPKLLHHIFIKKEPLKLQ